MHKGSYRNYMSEGLRLEAGMGDQVFDHPSKGPFWWYIFLRRIWNHIFLHFRGFYKNFIKRKFIRGARGRLVYPPVWEVEILMPASYYLHIPRYECYFPSKPCILACWGAFPVTRLYFRLHEHSYHYRTFSRGSDMTDHAMYIWHGTSSRMMNDAIK